MTIASEEGGWPPGFPPEPERALLSLDFDGTLARIVEDPGAAQPLPGVPALLARLAERLGTVAVVSGRPVAFLSEALGAAAGVRLFGLYGAETVGPAGELVEWPGLAALRPTLDRVAGLAERTRPAGAVVEEKGLALTLHWRRAERLADAARWAAAVVGDAAECGLVAHPGRRSVELRPAGAPDKGTVVAGLAGTSSAAAHCGDDEGDLPAFRVLASLRARGVPVLAVAVGSDEAPPALLGAADVVLEGPEELVRSLHLLAGRLEERRKGRGEG